jgi:hypothetical protein
VAQIPSPHHKGAPGPDSRTWETTNPMRCLGLRSLDPGSFQELPYRDDGNPLIAANPQQMPISADDKIGFAREGALQNGGWPRSLSA